MSSHSSFTYDCPHIGLYRLRYLANLKGHDCNVFDSSLVDVDGNLKKLNPSAYDMIGISVSHSKMEEDLSMISYLNENKKGNKPLIIAGGQEATQNGEQWLKGGVDLIFTGYAEESFSDALDFISSDFNKSKNKLKNLKGVMYLENGSVVFNPNKCLTLEDFVKNNHDLVLDMDLPYEKYWEKARKNTEALNFSKSIFIPEAARLYTSSSCPYNCGFCSSSGFIPYSQQKPQKPLRLNSEQVYHQILHHINKYGAKCFLFQDDEFMVDKQRIRELCQKIIGGKENGSIDKGILFNPQARVTDFLLGGKNSSVDYEFIDNLAKAGFHSIGLGIETFSDKLISKPCMNKQGYNSAQSLNVVYSMLEGGIVPHVFQILFTPEGDIEDIKINIRRGMEVVRKGGQLVVTPVLRSSPGAPIYNNSSYPFKIKTFVNKISGEKLEISGNYIPWDPFLADCADRVFDLIDEEVSDFENKWKFGRIPKSIEGILYYIATSKLLKDSSLVKECYGLIDEKTKELEKKLMQD